MPGTPALYTEALGRSGPRLLFLHGLSASTRYWRPRVTPLAADHRLVLADLLGFGRSPKPWVSYTVDRHVAALESVIVAEAPVTLVGHSFGAIAAAAYAAAHPDQVERLILMGLPAFASEEQALAFSQQRSFPDRLLLTNRFLAAVTCVVTRRLMPGMLRRWATNLPPEVIEDLGMHTWRSSSSTLWEGVYRHDVARTMERLPTDMPVLLIHGDQDTSAPLIGLTRVLDAHPRTRLRILGGVDHHPMIRSPEQVRGLIRSFVRGSLPGGEMTRPRHRAAP